MVTAYARLDRRNRTYGTSVEVDVEISISDLSTEDLVAELRARQQWPDEPEELFTEIREAVLERNFDEALLLIDRAMRPKFKTPDHAAQEYAKATGRQAKSF